MSDHVHVEWKDLCWTAADLLEHVDIVCRDVKCKIGDEIHGRQITQQTIDDVLRFQKYALNSKNQQCYEAEYTNDELIIRYKAPGLD